MVICSDDYPKVLFIQQSPMIEPVLPPLHSCNVPAEIRVPPR
nr:hypothetical protein [Candidatus Symbiopectobacterium sp.]